MVAGWRASFLRAARSHPVTRGLIGAGELPNRMSRIVQHRLDTTGLWPSLSRRIAREDRSNDLKHGNEISLGIDQ